MSIGTGIAIFFILWWTCLFVILPLGIRSQQEAGFVSPGSDPGAPAQTRIGRILLLTTGLTTLVFLLFRYLIFPLVW